MSKKTSKIALLIMAIVIIIGIVMSIVFGANYMLEKTATKTVIIELGEDFESLSGVRDIENAFKSAGYKSPNVMASTGDITDRAVVTLDKNSDANNLEKVQEALVKTYPDVIVGTLETVSEAKNSKNMTLLTILAFAAGILIICAYGWLRFGLKQGIIIALMVLVDTLFAYSLVIILRLRIPAGYEGALGAVAVISLLLHTGLGESIKNALALAGRKANVGQVVGAAVRGERLRTVLLSAIFIITLAIVLVMTKVAMLSGFISIMLIGALASVFSAIYIAPEL